MPEKHVFEYAVVRVVPRVEREEFLNVGVILYCRGLNFLRTRYEVPAERLRAFAGQAFDLAEITCRLQAFEQISKGHPDGGAIGQLTPAERFRWLTAARSTIVQTSAVHPGRTDDAAATLDRLYEQLVGGGRDER